MTDVGLRDLGSFVPGRRTRDIRREPTAAPPSAETQRTEPQVADAPVLVTPPPPATVQQRVFAGDDPDGADALGIDETLGHMAQLALHKGSQGPLSIGLIGRAGSGKSFALSRLATRIRALAAAASKQDGPFASRVHVETIDAAALDGAPDLALAARLHGGLQATYPDVAREIGAAARDPHAALRAAEEKLDEMRRRLDTERRALDDAGSRRARLTETVLYEAAGSQIDAYARANRAAIESRLTRFGIHGDPIRNFKDLVQLAAGSGSTLGLGLSALWAYKGQLKLVVAALALMAVGIGLGVAIDTQAGWLEAMRGGPKAGGALADWMQDHIGLLSTAKSAAYLLALAALAANVLRAVAFLRPVLKGARLLDSDLDSRRRELDGLCAHQTKRVDALERAVDRLSREVGEAEKRAGSAPGTRFEPSPFEAAASLKGQDAFAALAAAMANPQLKAPQRIVLALEHLDAVAPARARAILDALHRVAGSGLVTIVGIDTARLDAEDDARDLLERWIQVPVRLDAPASAEARQALVKAALGQAAPAAATSIKLEPGRSDLDGSIADEEVSLLAALSDLAGRTPRALKRFANLYRLARLGEARPLGPLAFMLAVMLGGTAAERRAAVEAAAGDASARYELPGDAARLQAALAAAVALGGRITRGEAAEAARRAATFAL